MGKAGKVFTNGLLNENPTFRLVLGTCPTIAITTQAMNGIGMGLAATFVLIGSNIVISLLRKFIPDKVRIPAFIVIICMFVTSVQMLMHAFVPELYKSLGIFIPLIVVNCIILARAEAFASKNSVFYSALDGLGMGLGFTAAITCIGAIREISNADTLIVAGTSLSVEPAAGFIEHFSGKNLVVINKEETRADDKATLVIHDDVAEVFGRLTV